MGFHGVGIGGRMESHVVGEKNCISLTVSGTGGHMGFYGVGEKEDAWNGRAFLGRIDYKVQGVWLFSGVCLLGENDTHRHASRYT